MHLNSGTLSSAILCLNTFFPPLLQPLSFDYSLFEEWERFANSTGNKRLLPLTVVIKISYMNNTVTLLLCPCLDPGLSGMKGTWGSGGMGIHRSLHLTSPPKHRYHGLTLNEALKRDIISLQSMGYLKYLCIYFKNKINSLTLVWMEAWHQGIAISVLHRRLLLLLWFLWCGCCKPMELHQYTIMQLYCSTSELFFLCFSFSLSTRKAQAHKSQIIEIIIK